MKAFTKSLLICLFCLSPCLLLQAGGEVCPREDAFLEMLGQEEELGGILNIYTTGHHAFLELHKQEKGAWTESSYSLYPKDSDSEEGWLEWFADQGSLNMVSVLLVAKVFSGLGLCSFAEPGYIAVNSSDDHGFPVDYLPRASFELTKEQVLNLEAFLAESIEAFNRGVRMYDPDFYHCQDFVQEAINVIGVDGAIHDHLPERSLLKGGGSVDVGSVSLFYKKYGVLPTLWQFLNEWMSFTPEISFSTEVSGEIFVRFIDVCHSPNECLGVYDRLDFTVEAHARDGAVALDTESIRSLEKMFNASHAGAFHPQNTLNVFHEGEQLARWPLNRYLQEHLLTLKNSEGYDGELVMAMEIQEFQGSNDSQKVYVLQIEARLP